MTADEPAAVRRWSSRLLLAAALLLLVGNLLHPVDAVPTATSRFAFATAPSWVAIHLAGGAGVLLAAAGLVLLGRATPAGTLPVARVGGLAAMVGGAVMAVVFAALDGYGVAALADRWTAAVGSERAMVEGAAIALEAIDTGLAGLGTLLLLGVALLATGAVVRATRPVAVWLGWAATGVGAAGTVTGALLLLAGPTPAAINGMLRPTAGAATLLFVALGVALGRPAPAPPAPAGVHTRMPAHEPAG